jgi:hypothetical protein
MGLARGLEVASEYFMGKADVQSAARRIAARLQELGIEYAIAGGLAVTAHGHLRVTTDVDLLLTEEGLARFKAESLGRGWVEKFAGSTGVRDTVHDVEVDVLLTGGFPGDGQPADLAFPDPSDASDAQEGLRYINLRVLVELKIASGLTAPDRLQDFADVIQLVRVNGLDAEFAARLHESVREKYVELWGYAQLPTREL